MRMTDAAGDLRCAACGETEALHGKRRGDEIEVTCERCGATWTRKPGAACERCGRKDLEVRKEPIVERVRGTQMAMQGFRTVYRCPSCDEAV
ncbi:MAG: hypothetical protein ACRDGT_02640 [Candidatus Limnocylindria bacterium]